MELLAHDLLAAVTKIINDHGNCKVAVSTVDSPDAPPFGVARLRVEHGPDIVDLPVHRWTSRLQAEVGPRRG